MQNGIKVQETELFLSLHLISLGAPSFQPSGMTRRTLTVLLSFAFSLGVQGTKGISLPFTRRAATPHSTSLNVSAVGGGADPFGFVNKVDLYAATIFVQGQPFVVSAAGLAKMDRL